jgi:hypothetical protein
MNNQLQATDRQSQRRGFLWGALFTAFIGGNAFISVSSNPRFETIHVLDVMRLMLAGAAVAVTLVLLIQFFVRGPLSEDKRAGEKSVKESN